MTGLPVFCAPCNCTMNCQLYVSCIILSVPKHNRQVVHFNILYYLQCSQMLHVKYKRNGQEVHINDLIADFCKSSSDQSGRTCNDARTPLAHAYKDAHAPPLCSSGQPRAPPTNGVNLHLRDESRCELFAQFSHTMAKRNQR